VDAPYWFGRIAAANSLSDVYAMGARPVSAVNFVGYPLDDLGGEVLAAILQGSFDALKEADCPMAGGHSIQDKEIKFGLAVAGVVHPDRIIQNSTARPGDVLVLTKPLGLGFLTTALKAGAVAPEHIDAGQRMMARLNRNASEAIVRVGVSAATDVTGFGMLGHTYEMAAAAGVTIRIRAADVPVLEEARPYIDAKFTCGGSKRNAKYAEAHSRIAPGVTDEQHAVLTDVQTSGGLLVSVPAGAADDLLDALREGGDAQAAVIGDVRKGAPGLEIY
jgi:selenide,water dikinase